MLEAIGIGLRLTNPIQPLLLQPQPRRQRTVSTLMALTAWNGRSTKWAKAITSSERPLYESLRSKVDILVAKGFLSDYGNLLGRSAGGPKSVTYPGTKMCYICRQFEAYGSLCRWDSGRRKGLTASFFFSSARKISRPPATCSV
jgi:hypothetical protein